MAANIIDRKHESTIPGAYLLLKPIYSGSHGILLPTEVERWSAAGLLLLESPSFSRGYLQSVVQSPLYDVGASEMQQRVDPVFRLHQPCEIQTSVLRRSASSPSDANAQRSQTIQSRDPGKQIHETLRVVIKIAPEGARRVLT